MRKRSRPGRVSTVEPVQCTNRCSTTWIQAKVSKQALFIPASHHPDLLTRRGFSDLQLIRFLPEDLGSLCHDRSLHPLTLAHICSAPTSNLRQLAIRQRHLPSQFPARCMLTFIQSNLLQTIKSFQQPSINRDLGQG
jgi:hypothetical protein